MAISSPFPLRRINEYEFVLNFDQSGLPQQLQQTSLIQMYATISLRRLLALVAATFGPILLVYLLVTGLPQNLTEAPRKLGTATTIWTVLILAIFAPTHQRWAVWRHVWKWAPPLNKLAFPDLNGTWKGKTSSNWPSIQAMLESAKGNGGLDHAKLSEIPLKSDDITLTIKASLFSFRISATLSATGGTSHSLTERVTEDKRRGVLELYYIYRQETPEPVATDESSHPGAACLDIDLDAWTMKGAYWTKRSWRSGLNTAGRIEVGRASR